MTTAILTIKGRITIPIDVRNGLKLDAGDRLEFVHIGAGRYELVAVTSEVTMTVERPLPDHRRAKFEKLAIPVNQYKMAQM